MTYRIWLSMALLTLGLAMAGCSDDDNGSGGSNGGGSATNNGGGSNGGGSNGGGEEQDGDVFLSEANATRTYLSLAAGISNCGLYQEDGHDTVEHSCGNIWTDEFGGNSEYAYIDSWNVTSCGLRADNGDLECWGTDVEGDMDNYDGDMDADFVSITLGDRNGCGLDADGEIHCFWSLDHWDERPDVADPPSGSFERLAGGQTNFCGIRSDDQSIECWGDDRLEMSDAPSGAFIDLSLGMYGGCAIRAEENSIACWGRDNDELVVDYPDGQFQAIAYNSIVACALDLEGRPHCWGDTEDIGQPDVELREVSTSRGPGVIGIRASDDRVVSW